MNKTIAKIAAGSFLLASAGAFAATVDGTLGLTSTGTLDILASKGNTVQISALTTITFPAAASLAADAIQFDDACVFSTTGNYTVQATSPNASGAQLRLNDGGVNFMNYSLGLYDATGGSAGAGVGTALTHNVTTATIAGADTVSATCAGGTNISLEATILQADFNGAVNGNYSDTVTLLFSPI